MNEQVKLWARAGVSFKVDREAFLEAPEAELRRVFQDGAFELDGETYIPEGILDDEGLDLGDKEVAIQLNPSRMRKETDDGTIGQKTRRKAPRPQRGGSRRGRRTRRKSRG